MPVSRQKFFELDWLFIYLHWDIPSNNKLAAKSGSGNINKVK
jgi:hypothetical protein